MTDSKTSLTHAIFFCLELIVAPVVAYAAAYGIIRLDILKVPTVFVVMMAIFFCTFMICIGIFSYIHFKRIEQPDFRTALFRALIGLILAFAFLAALAVLNIRLSYYLTVCVPVFSVAAAFNSVLFLKKH